MLPTIKLNAREDGKSALLFKDKYKEITEIFRTLACSPGFVSP